MEKVAVDKSTRMYDEVVLTTLDKYLGYQVEKLNGGVHRNPEKFKQGADELLQRCEMLQDLETATRKGQKLELPKWYKELYQPEPKKIENKTGRQTC